MEIGIQLYSLRDHLTGGDTSKKTLETIADIGYKNVELAGFCGFEANEFKSILDNLGLNVVSAHIGYDDVKPENINATIEKYKYFNCPNLGIGWADFSNFKAPLFDDFAATLNQATEVLEKHNMKLHYHNHAHEFEKVETGEFGLYRLAKSVPKLNIELDTYWIQAGASSPKYVILAAAGRITLLHCKDMAIINAEQKMTPIGTGNLNFAHILKAAKSSGVEYLIIEQDDFYGADQIAAMTTSYNNLKLYLAQV